MPAYDLDSDARTIAARLAAPDTLLVACLCAAWCDTCRAYRTTFDALAGLYPGICFVWIDIETHADRIETLEIENFPTILIEDAHRTRFFGVVPAKKRILERLIRHFMAEERMQGDAAPSLRLCWFRAFFSGLPCVASRSPYCAYCLRARSLGNLTEKCSIQAQLKPALVFAEYIHIRSPLAARPAPGWQPLPRACLHRCSPAPSNRQYCARSRLSGYSRIDASPQPAPL